MEQKTTEELGAASLLPSNRAGGSHHQVRQRAWRAIIWGGLIAGGSDLLYALTFYGVQNIKPIRIVQSIASGLLGMSAFEGGWSTAILGVFFQFLIAVTAAAIYYLASGKLNVLLSRAPVCGAIYGAAIYFFMREIVLPLSAAPKFRTTPISIATDFSVHVLLIGLPIALITRSYRSALPISSVRLAEVSA